MKPLWIYSLLYSIRSPSKFMYGKYRNADPFIHLDATMCPLSFLFLKKGTKTCVSPLKLPFSRLNPILNVYLIIW